MGSDVVSLRDLSSPEVQKLQEEIEVTAAGRTILVAAFEGQLDSIRR